MNKLEEKELVTALPLRIEQKEAKKRILEKKPKVVARRDKPSYSYVKNPKPSVPNRKGVISCLVRK